MFYSDSTGTIYFLGGGETNCREAVIGSISNKQWHQIAITFTGASTTGLKYYWDGNMARAATSTVGDTNLSNGNNIQIGRNAASYPFNGLIDEVKIYNRVLSPAEIEADYNAWWATTTGKNFGTYTTSVIDTTATDCNFFAYRWLEDSNNMATNILARTRTCANANCSDGSWSAWIDGNGVWQYPNQAINRYYQLQFRFDSNTSWQAPTLVQIDTNYTATVHNENAITLASTGETATIDKNLLVTGNIKANIDVNAGRATRANQFFDLNGNRGIDRNVHIVKSTDLVTVTYCDMNYRGGILIASDC
jgi:hypothetical protein